MFLDPFATIVIGASAGGVEAAIKLAANLPRDFSAAVFVVLHVGRHPSILPELLNRSGPLPACHARQGQQIEPGHIYVAPPDHHLLLDNGYIRLTRGPRINWARPAIDPLFSSAAHVYADRVIGVVLTGGLSDGSAGLLAVRQAGGIAIVQDPADAANPEMPANALRYAGADFLVPLVEIPALLIKIVEDMALSSVHPVQSRWRAIL